MAAIAAALGAVLVIALGGCVSSRPAAPPAALPGAAVAPSQRTIEYPHGRLVLQGDGTARSPYEWIWVPSAPPPSRP
jgi:hypothetical protein